MWNDIIAPDSPSVLDYTSATSSVCDESLKIFHGKSCLSKTTLHKLEKIAEDLTSNLIERGESLIPVEIDQEVLPSDGSYNSIMIRRLAAALDCSSEYCLLENKKIIKILGPDVIKEEKKRFKVPGPRHLNEGTDGDCHSYETLVKWSKVFDFFHPLKHAVYTKDNRDNEITVEGVMKIVNSTYPKIRVIAADLTVEIKYHDTNIWHSLVLLIDMRSVDSPWTIEMFDSIGKPPPDFMIELSEKLRNKLEEFKINKAAKAWDKNIIFTNKNVEIINITNKKRFQLSMNECGMYSLIFIRRRLEGISHKMFYNYIIPVSFAKEFRRMVFV